MLQLNQLSIENIEENISRANSHLAAWIERFQDNTRTPEQNKNSVFKITDFYFMLAYAKYALEEHSEVKPNFEKAAPFAFLCGFDPKLKTSNNDWTIQQELNVVLLFAEQDVLEKLKHSEIKLSSVQHQAKLQYAELLKAIGTGQTINKDDVEAALLEAKNTKDKDVLQYILPLLEAISALVSGDELRWQTSIDKAITWHKDECKFGDYKDMEEGFICLNALTMAKLGKDMHGWQCHTDSLYLPLFLID